MTIHEVIKQDAKEARKEGYKQTLSDLNFILGEFSRLKGTKIKGKLVSSELSDEQAIYALNKIIKAELKLADITGEKESNLMRLAKAYLPQQLSEGQIRDYLNKVDWSKYKNKFQVIGDIKKEFGDQVDAALVRKLLENY